MQPVNTSEHDWFAEQFAEGLIKPPICIVQFHQNPQLFVSITIIFSSPNDQSLVSGRLLNIASQEPS